MSLGRRVRSIGPLTRTVADLSRAEAFYCTRLGFRLAARPGPGTVRLQLGEQSLELRVGRPGRPAAANNTRFQHAAIVVADMARAYAAVADATPISQGGPQMLAGGLRAYKFRDPDRHPLELLQFGPGQGRACWRCAGDTRLFRGIDHSAITVRDTEASLRFYRDGLGLRVSSRSLNRGAAQQALDDVPAPVVRVTQLAPVDPLGMRLELLDYRTPRSMIGPRIDAGADRLALHLSGTGFPLSARRPQASRDPDGHRLLLAGPPPARTC